MKENGGVGQTLDLLLFASMVALGSSALISMSFHDSDWLSQRYATSVARRALVSLQWGTVGEIGEFSFHLSIETIWKSEFVLKRKTFVQLIAEDAILNPRPGPRGNGPILSSNPEFDGKVRDFLKRALDELVGGRFGYRFVAEIAPVERSGEVTNFELVVESDRGPEKLCSESVSWPLPPVLTGAREWDLKASRSRLVLVMTLELWSK